MPAITSVHPLRAVEGGRITILGSAFSVDDVTTVQIGETGWLRREHVQNCFVRVSDGMLRAGQRDKLAMRFRPGIDDVQVAHRGFAAKQVHAAFAIDGDFDSLVIRAANWKRREVCDEACKGHGLAMVIRLDWLRGVFRFNVRAWLGREFDGGSLEIARRFDHGFRMRQFRIACWWSRQRWHLRHRWRAWRRLDCRWIERRRHHLRCNRRLRGGRRWKRRGGLQWNRRRRSGRGDWMQLHRRPQHITRMQHVCFTIGIQLAGDRLRTRFFLARH